MFDCGYYETPPADYQQLGLLCTSYGQAQHKVSPCQSRRLACYAAVWIPNGTGWLETSATTERLPIQRGSLFWLSPGVMHTYMPYAEGWTERWALFEGVQAQAFERLGFFSATHPVQTPDNVAAIELIFEQLHATFAQQSPLSCVLGGILISQLIVLAHQQALENSGVQHPLLHELQQYKKSLEEHAFESCSLEEIANHHPRSYATLRRHFKQVFGFAPREYVLHLRVRKAKASLAFTQQSISEIARSVGFTDPYYFSRLFHTKTGLTPSLFRTQQHGLPQPGANLDLPYR